MRMLAGGIFLLVFLPLLQGQPNHAYLKTFVDKSVAAGVAYLKKNQAADGTWGRTDIGATALAGLALMEAGCPADEPALVKARLAVLQQAFSTTQTYSIALSLLFLDRLGTASDIPIIESLGVRLLAGQGSSGGWGYNCPGLANEEQTRLQNLQSATVELKGARTFPKVGSPRKSFTDLPLEIQKQIRQIQVTQAAEGNALEAGSNDNSNTQFATLALWVARRHGIPVDIPMQKIRIRFARSQGPDGGWGYTPGTSSSVTMTAAGCLCLGLSSGFLFEKAQELNLRGNFDPAKDPFLLRGLQALGSCTGVQAGAGKQAYFPRLGNQAGQSYYFLWSLERVARGLGLATLARKDWYAWGAEIIVASQSPEGGWDGDYREYFADTSFAILFLTKANLAQDLTTLLRGSVNDPGVVELRTGGVGGTGLVDLATKKGLGLAIGGKGEGASQGKMKYNQTKKDTPGKTVTTPNPKDNQPIDSHASQLKSPNQAMFMEALESLKNGKGVEFSLTLAKTIPELAEDRKLSARRALAERLAGFSPATIASYLDNPLPEARAGAINALALREIDTYLEAIVDHLGDPSPWVRKCSLLALKQLAGKEFPPQFDSSPDDPIKLIAAWKSFLKSRPAKVK